MRQRAKLAMSAVRSGAPPPTRCARDDDDDGGGGSDAALQSKNKRDVFARQRYSGYNQIVFLMIRIHYLDA